MNRKFSHIRLQVIADEKDMSQKFIADELGTYPANVNRWFTGKVKPSADSLAALAALLDVSVNDFYDSEQLRLAS